MHFRSSSRIGDGPFLRMRSLLSLARVVQSRIQKVPSVNVTARKLDSRKIC